MSVSTGEIVIVMQMHSFLCTLFVVLDDVMGEFNSYNKGYTTQSHTYFLWALTLYSKNSVSPD